MADNEKPVSAERAAINEARKAAAAEIDNFMHQGALRAYERLLTGLEAGEQHRFGPMIDWAMKLIEHDALRDTLSVSRPTLARWVSGEATPGPFARQSVLQRIEQLTKKCLDK